MIQPSPVKKPLVIREDKVKSVKASETDARRTGALASVEEREADPPVNPDSPTKPPRPGMLPIDFIYARAR